MYIIKGFFVNYFQPTLGPALYQNGPNWTRTLVYRSWLCSPFACTMGMSVIVNSRCITIVSVYSKDHKHLHVHAQLFAQSLQTKQLCVQRMHCTRLNITRQLVACDFLTAACECSFNTCVFACGALRVEWLVFLYNILLFTGSVAKTPPSMIMHPSSTTALISSKGLKALSWFEKLMACLAQPFNLGMSMLEEDVAEDWFTQLAYEVQNTQLAYEVQNTQLHGKFTLVHGAQPMLSSLFVLISVAPNKISLLPWRSPYILSSLWVSSQSSYVYIRYWHTAPFEANVSYTPSSMIRTMVFEKTVDKVGQDNFHQWPSPVSSWVQGTCSYAITLWKCP